MANQSVETKRESSSISSTPRDSEHILLGYTHVLPTRIGKGNGNMTSGVGSTSSPGSCSSTYQPAPRTRRSCASPSSLCPSCLFPCPWISCVPLRCGRCLGRRAGCRFYKLISRFADIREKRTEQMLGCIPQCGSRYRLTREWQFQG